MIGLIFNCTHPKLRASVAPCETRRMISTENLHDGISHTKVRFNCTHPKLRASVAPCETRRMIRTQHLHNGTSHTEARRHGGLEGASKERIS